MAASSQDYYLYVYIFKIKFKQRNIRDFPTIPQLHAKAENFLLTQIQSQAFEDEIFILMCGKDQISKTNSLFQCSPFIDESQVIRIKARIGVASAISDYAKRPIILPRGHYCTNLIIQHYHNKFHHIHHQTCLNELRQMF